MRSTSFALLAALALARPGLAAAQQAGGMVVLRGTIDEDAYLAGGIVDSRAKVRGDVAAAGGQVSIAGDISGDVLAVAGQVDLVGTVGDDVRVAGGQVRLVGEVGGDAVAAGADVGLGAEAAVGGRALLAGGLVEVAGRVGKDLRVAGGTVRLSGRVGGDVLVAAERLEILDGASIGGRLSYVSPEPARIAPGARIVGPVAHRLPEARGRTGAAVLGLLFLAGVFLLGWLLQFLFPRFGLRAAQDIGAEPAKCLGVGAALVLGGPIAVVLLLASVLGTPLGLVAAAVYLVSLLLGYLVAALWLGDLALRRLWRLAQPTPSVRLLSFLAALLALRLVRLVPLLGGFLVFAAVVMGVGALVVQAGRARLAAGRAADVSAR